MLAATQSNSIVPMFAMLTVWLRLLVVAILVAFAEITFAQAPSAQSELTGALYQKTHGTHSLAREDQFASKMVEEIDALAKTTGVLITRNASRHIVDFLTEGEVPERVRREGPLVTRAEEEADRKRFALLLLSFSRADKPVNTLVLDERSVSKLFKRLRDYGIDGFCPCWPICRGKD